MTVKFNKTKPGLAAGIGRVQAFWREGKYQQALNEVNDLVRNWADNPRLLVMRACLIQLQDNESGPSLEDAKADLQRAILLDDQSPSPLVELAHFQLAVEDNPRVACKTFERVANLTRVLLKEALLGQADALSELDRRQEALARLVEAFSIHSHKGNSHPQPDEEEILERLDALKNTRW